MVLLVCTTTTTDDDYGMVVGGESGTDRTGFINVVSLADGDDHGIGINLGEQLYVRLEYSVVGIYM